MVVLDEGRYARILDSFQSYAFATALTCKGKPCTHLGCSDLAGCESACGNPFTSEKARCTQQAERKAGKPVTIPSGVGTAKQVAPSILGTSQPSSDRLSPQDQDCANFGSSGLNAALGNIPEQFCVAGKSITKTIQCPPQLGGLCQYWWLILLGGIGFVVYKVVKGR